MITGLILAAATAATNPAAARSPDIFGMMIGQPLPYAECPPYTDAKGRIPKRSTSPYTSSLYAYGRPADRSPCYYRNHKQGTDEPLGPYESVQVHFPEQLQVATGPVGVTVNGGRIVSIGMETRGEVFQDTDVEVLTGKYGPPKEIDRELMQNGFGAKFVRIRATWDFGGGVLGRYFGFRDTRDKGAFNLSTADDRAESDRQMQRLVNYGRKL
jgi:hypothetical protein